MPTLIQADELAAALAASTPPRLLDVRWKLGGPPGRPLHAAGHIPGAVYVDLDTELAGHGLPTDGRHPLPDIEVLQAAARRWGLNPGDAVVVYDDLSALSAARAWWLLRYAGLSDVRVLDGGLAAWIGAGFELESGDVDARAGHRRTRATVTCRPSTRMRPQRSPATECSSTRGPAERYRGEVEPIDPRAGHIPGAVSAPTTDNLGADGRFLPPERPRGTLRGARGHSGCSGRRLLRLRRHGGARSPRTRTRRLRRRRVPGLVVGVVERPGPSGRHRRRRRRTAGVTRGNSPLPRPASTPNVDA